MNYISTYMFLYEFRISCRLACFHERAHRSAASSQLCL